MHPKRIAALVCSFACSAFILAGCHRPPEAPPLSSSYSIARDGSLRYRLPAGWFDVTADSQAHGNAVWLLRNDYAATITVNEVRVDANARRELERTGLISLANLTAALSTQDKGTVIDRQPREFVLQGHRCCSYGLANPATGDRTNVVLLDTGARVYAVSALTAAGAPGVSAPEIDDVQMEFLEACRW